MIDDRDEDRIRRERHRERIERMRLEKERQEKLNQRVRTLLPYGVGIFVVIIAVSVGATWGKSAKADEGTPTQPPNQVLVKGAESDSQTGKTLAGQVQESGNQTKDVAFNTPEEGSQNSENLIDSKVQEGSQTQEGSKVQEDNLIQEGSKAQPDNVEAVNDKIPYSFEATEETKTIYSDEVISTNAILIDESTDRIIASKGAKERISPASMTKVLTVLVAAEELSKEDLEDTFTMTLEITDYAYVNDCSSVGFLDGERVKVKDLFYGTILPSGGDAAVGLATYVAGSHEKFVELMNDKLKELGLSDSAHFTNCVGLYDKEHYCTVYDMAVIMKAAMKNELCREFLSAHTYTTTPTTEHPEGITISNWFLRRIEDKDTGGEVLCAKTGYVVESKNCAVSYGSFAGQTPYICVTAGASSSWRCIYDHVEIYNKYISE